MIAFIKSYRIPLALVLLLFVFHLFSKDFNNPYERPIAGDAQAYHAYLPAIFIYNDLSYGFVDEMNVKYYPESHRKSFLKPAGNGKVNKTFPGVTLLYLPFFLIAHFLALMFGLEADGYSTIYQVCFDIGLWFYLFLGLVFFIKVLRKLNFSTAVANTAMGIILLGTNMVFYSVYDQSVTHIYNFFMINAMLFFLLSFKNEMTFNHLAKALFLLVLIGITRPTNILVVGLILFFIPELDFYKKMLRSIFKSSNLWRIAVIVLPLLALPFILWKLQTGNWVVYSYGDEGFDFAHPHYADFLFSYLKGWFVYTPLALLVLLIGLPILFKAHKIRFVIALVFYSVSVYVFSSWWCWYYGAGMGQRVMIDHYILLGFLIALIMQTVMNSGWKRITLATVGVLCIGLNFAQAWQIRYGILNGGSATGIQYWDNFLRFEQRARVYPHEHWILEEERSYNLEASSPAITKGQSYFIEDTWTIQVSDYDNYSAVVDLGLLNVRKGSKVIVSFDARARHEIIETRVAYDLNGMQKTFRLSPYCQKDEWVKIEFMIEPNEAIISPILMFFWNGGSQEKVEIKNLETRHYFSESYL